REVAGRQAQGSAAVARRRAVPRVAAAAPLSGRCMAATADRPFLRVRPGAPGFSAHAAFAADRRPPVAGMARSYNRNGSTPPLGPRHFAGATAARATANPAAGALLQELAMP